MRVWKRLLKELRLPTIREQYTVIAEQAARDHWTHLQFLSELASKECTSRQENRIVRLMKEAHLLPGKTWDQFQWSRLPLHVAQQFEVLRSGSFLDRQDNLLILGKLARGKRIYFRRWEINWCVVVDRFTSRHARC